MDTASGGTPSSGATNDSQSLLPKNGETQNGHTSGMEKAKAVGAVLLDGAIAGATLLSGVLPGPAGPAMALLAELGNIVNKAIVNKANLLELAGRAQSLAGIMGAYYSSTMRATAAADAGAKMVVYKKTLDRFMEILRNICDYAKAYTSRSIIMRMLSGYWDGQKYEGHCQSLETIRKDVMLVLAFDSNTALQGLLVQEQQKAASAKLPVDDSALLVSMAKQRVTERGGLEAVAGSPEKMKAVLDSLKVEPAVGPDMISALLMSYLEKGPHDRIKQSDLRVFWRKQYGGKVVEAPWEHFWTIFPSKLRENFSDSDDPSHDTMSVMVGELERVLAGLPRTAAASPAVGNAVDADSSADDVVVADVTCDAAARRADAAAAARRAFQDAVERLNGEYVSVFELEMAFNDEEDLVTQVEDIVQRSAKKAAAIPGSEKVPTPPEPLYGRDDDLGSVTRALQAGPVALIAPGGCGKTALASAVARQLLQQAQQKQTPLGVTWLSMRGVQQLDQVRGRLCDVFGIKQAAMDGALNEAMAQCIATALRTEPPPTPPAAVVAAAGMTAAAKEAVDASLRYLVIIDDIGEAIVDGEACKLVKAMLQAILEVPGARVLVTSRKSLLPSLNPVSSSSSSSSSATATTAATAAAKDLRIPEIAMEGIPEEAAREMLYALATATAPASATAVNSAVDGATNQRNAVERRQYLQAARTCQCIPLVLRLVGDALAAGRLTVQEVLNRKAGDSSTSLLPVIISGLRPPQQLAMLQLTVFPSSFDVDSGSAVLGLEREQATSLLAELQRHGLLTSSDSVPDLRCYSMHGAVRDAAFQLQASLGMQLLEPVRALGAQCGSSVPLLQPAVESGLAFKVVAELLLEAEDRYIQQVLAVLWECMRMHLEYSKSKAVMDRLQEWKLDLWQLAKLLSAKGGRANWLTRPRMLEDVLELGGFLGEKGYNPQAELLLKAALRSQEERLREMQLLRADGLHKMAWSILGQGRFNDAQPEFEKVLKIRKELLNENDIGYSKVAEALNGLAVCLKSHGQLTEAEARYREAWRIFEQHPSYGKYHSKTATAIDNLANCTRAQGRSKDAMELYNEALSIRRQLLSDEQNAGKAELQQAAAAACSRIKAAEKSVASSLNNQGNCYFDEGMYDKAASKYQQALKIWRGGDTEQQQGDSTDVARATQNLARVLFQQGRYPEALELYGNARKMREKLLGSDHPDVATNLRREAACKAELAQTSSQFEEAELLFVRALDLQRKVLGSNHVDVGLTLVGLAALYDRQGRHKDAHEEHRKAADILLQLGQDHPDFLHARLCLADCLRAQVLHPKAEELYRAVLDSRERCKDQYNNQRHPDVAAAWHGLGMCLEYRCKIESAVQAYDKAQQIFTDMLGSKHSRTVAAVRSYSELFPRTQQIEKQRLMT